MPLFDVRDGSPTRASGLPPRKGGDAFAMEGRTAEGDFVRLRALEPEVHVVLPGEPDSAMDLHGTVRRPGIDLAKPSLRHRSGTRCVARQVVLRPGGVPEQRAGRLDLGDALGGHMLYCLEGADRTAKLLALLRVLDGHV